MTGVGSLRQESRCAAARLHLKETEEIRSLNAAVYTRSPMEEWGSASLQRRMLSSLDGASGLVEELRARVAGLEGKVMAEPASTIDLRGRVVALEAERDAGLRRAARQERDADEALQAQLRGLSQRLMTMEARCEQSERSAADAIARADALARTESIARVEAIARAEAIARSHLSEALSSNEAEVRQCREATMRMEVRMNLLEETLRRRDANRSNATEVAARSGNIEQVRALAQQLQSALEDETSRTDTLRERVARLEEQLRAQRSQSEATTADLKISCDDAKTATQDEREKTARLVQRLSAAESANDERHSTLAARLDALGLDVNFLRDHQARLETQFICLQREPSFLPEDDDPPPPFHGDDDVSGGGPPDEEESQDDLFRTGESSFPSSRGERPSRHYH